MGRYRKPIWRDDFDGLRRHCRIRARPYSTANEGWSCRRPQARRRLRQTPKNATGSTSARARTHQSGAVHQPSRQDLQRPSRNHLSLPLGVRGLVNSLCRFSVPLSRTGRIWVKTKFLNRQEFVIVGWTDPEGSRSSLGSLLLGCYRDDGKLIYAGRAGTGMTESELRALLNKLRPLASDKMTVDVPPPKTSRFGKPLVLTRLHWG